MLQLQRGLRMTMMELTFALLALLLTPGPTNTLVALAASARGWRGALRLLPYEIAAYLLVTLPLALLGALALEAAPVLRPAVTLASGLWVMGLAIRMWHPSLQAGAAEVTARHLFITTLLNPKVLIFGLVLLPGPQLALHMVLFVALIALVAVVWAGIGACMAGRSDCPLGQTLPLLSRAAGLWLGVLAIGLVLTALPQL